MRALLSLQLVLTRTRFVASASASASVSVSVSVSVSARARRRAGCGRGSEGLPCAALRVPCDARIPGRWPNSLRSLRSLRSDSRPPVRARSALRARPGILCFSAAPTRPTRTPPGALPATILVFDEWDTTAVCRPEGGTALGRLCAAEKVSRDTNSPGDCLCLANGRASWPGAACKARASGRAHRALRALTGGRLFERSERSERSEFGHRPEDRASQGTRSAAQGKHSEPRRRTALGPARAVDVKPGATSTAKQQT